MAATYLRCLLTVSDIAVSTAFYEEALDFKMLQSLPDGYTSFENGKVVIALMGKHDASEDSRAAAGPRGFGVEFIMEVRDVDALYARMAQSEWSATEPLQDQPWGLRDFAISDPDGYRWRVTSIDEEYPHDA